MLGVKYLLLMLCMTYFFEILLILPRIPLTTKFRTYYSL